MGQDDDVRSKRMTKLHSHVAEPAEADHANFLALGDAPMMHRRVGRDPGAEQRRGSSEIEVGWEAQNEVFIDDDAFGVTAVGHASEVLVRRIEGENHVRAELLETSLALCAGAVRIDHAADRGDVPGLVLGNCRADLDNAADDLVTGNNRVIRGHELAPLVAHRMQIGVADPAKQDFDLHVAVGWIAPVDFSGGQTRCRTRSGISLRVVGSWMHTPRLSSSLRIATESHAALVRAGLAVNRQRSRRSHRCDRTSTEGNEDPVSDFRFLTSDLRSSLRAPCLYSSSVNAPPQPKT